MINRSVQDGRARVNSKKLKKWGRSGRKERRSPGMICVEHWSVRMRSHTAALSSLDEPPSASETQDWICASELITCVLWMTDWRQVACADWQAL